MTAAHAFELPEDEPELNRAVQEATSGEVVYLTRRGQPIVALTSAAPVLNALDDAERIANTALDGVYEVAGSLARFIEQNVPDEQGRQQLLARLDALVEQAEDEADIATARSAVARIDAGLDEAIPWEQLKAELDL